MNQEIVFYHHPFSRGRIVRLMLEEVGVPYRVVAVDVNKGEQKTPEYRALNPMGKVPMIVHRDLVVTEAAAICAYLADAFSDRGLAPRLDDPTRGTYLRWLFFGAGCFEPALRDRQLDRPAGPPEVLGYGTFDDTVDTLEKAVQPGPFLLGERYSAADVYISSLLGYAIMMAKVIAPRPAFQAYLGRVRERPASQRAAAKDTELGESMKPNG
jgi:glutathione S-transferase